MPSFTTAEIKTICLFFGVPETPDVFELKDHFCLETGSVEHPIGDKLKAVKNGYIVTIDAPDEEEPYYYQRNLQGLLEALELITTTPA